MSTGDIFATVINALLDNDCFKDYKYRKKDNSLVRKTDYGFEMIELQSWGSYDLKRNKEAMLIKPLYSKRFSVIHKWFEKYSFKSLADQRFSSTIGFEGKQLDKQNEFYFLNDGTDLEKDLSSFINEVVKNASSVFNKFKDVKDLYQFYIEPLLNKITVLPDVGADWVFEYLTITKIVNEEKYDEVFGILKEHVDKMNKRGEPNIIEYYPKFTEISDCLINLKLTDSQT